MNTPENKAERKRIARLREKSRTPESTYADHFAYGKSLAIFRNLDKMFEPQIHAVRGFKDGYAEGQKECKMLNLLKREKADV